MLQDETVQLLPADDVVARPPRTLDNFKHLKRPGKIPKGLASQAIAAAASIGGWSDTQFFKYLATLLGEAYLSRIPASTSDIRLVLRNVIAGGSSCGIFLADATGSKKNDANAAQHAVIAGYTSSLILALVSSVGYAGTHLFLRYLFSERISDASVTYFDWGLIGNFPAVLITPMTQIALHCGAIKSAVVANLLFRFSIPLLSYVFIMQMGMREAGIDLANGLAPWIGYLFLAACMHWGSVFQDFRQWSFRADFIEANRKQFKPQFVKGLLMMSQRASEYLNVGVLGEMLSKLNEANLAKINPFLQTSPFCTLAALGLGMMGNMDTKEKHATLLDALKEAENSALSIDERKAALEECEELDRALRLIVRKTFLSGTVVNLVFTLLLIFLRNQITDIFVASDMSAADRAASSEASMVNAFGLVPDAWRIIASNLLNTYDKIVMPNAISLLLMTVFGIFPLYGYARGTSDDAFMSFFWVRNAMMLLSAGVIMKMLHGSMNADTQRIKVVRDVLEVAQLAAVPPVPADDSADERAVHAAVPMPADAAAPVAQKGYGHRLFNWMSDGIRSAMPSKFTHTVSSLP